MEMNDWVLDILTVAVRLEAAKITSIESIIEDGIHLKAAQIIAANADLLFKGDPKVFSAVVEGLAILSKMPGGVKFLGVKFQYP